MTILTAVARCPGARPGVAGQGTPHKSTMYQIGDQAFLFVRSIGEPVEVRLKLGPSRGEAATLATAQPAQCRVDADGWVTLLFPSPSSEAPEWLAPWIKESYAMMASHGSPA